MAERDKEYELYYRNLKSAWGLKDIHIARGYMRGSDPSWRAQRRPEELEHQKGMTDIVIVCGDATLAGVAEPAWVKEMIAEWEHQIIEKKPDKPREFTRTVIAQYMALNRHHESDAGDLLLCGAVWLMATHDELGVENFHLLQRGDVEFRYDITENAEQRIRRFRLSKTDFRHL
jgi:hypothetical protein